MKILSLSMLLLLTSCAFSVNLIHTEGKASDVIDENQTAKPDISTAISLPLKAI